MTHTWLYYAHLPFWPLFYAYLRRQRRQRTEQPTMSADELNAELQKLYQPDVVVDEQRSKEAQP